MEILLSWKRKWKQWRGFIRELKRHGIDFYDRNQPDFRTEDGIRQLIEQIALSVNSGYSAHLMKVQAQINALNSQINPHFLYNTLEMIRTDPGSGGCRGDGRNAFPDVPLQYQQGR